MKKIKGWKTLGYNEPSGQGEWSKGKYVVYITTLFAGSGNFSKYELYIWDDKNLKRVLMKFYKTYEGVSKSALKWMRKH